MSEHIQLALLVLFTVTVAGLLLAAVAHFGQHRSQDGEDKGNH